VARHRAPVSQDHLLDVVSPPEGVNADAQMELDLVLVVETLGVGGRFLEAADPERRGRGSGPRPGLSPRSSTTLMDMVRRGPNGRAR
jgi:hypothetical protein